MTFRHVTGDVSVTSRSANHGDFKPKGNAMRSLTDTELDRVSGGVVQKAGNDAQLYPVAIGGGAYIAGVYRPKEGDIITHNAVNLDVYNSWSAKQERSYLSFMSQTG